MPGRLRRANRSYPDAPARDSGDSPATSGASHPRHQTREVRVVCPGERASITPAPLSFVDNLPRCSCSLLMRDMDSASPVLKLCDFGASRYLKEVQGNDAAESSLDRLTHYVGSRWYRAPELMGNRTEYDELVDVWSSGTIIAEMVTGAALFQGEDETQVIASVCKLLGALPVALARSLEQHGLPLPARPVAQGTRTLQKMCGAKLGPKGIAMLEGMLEPDASRRPSASRIAAHAYLCEDDPVRAWDLDDGHVLRPLVDAVKATDLASTDDANLDSRCRAVARSLLDAPVATVDAWLSTFAEGRMKRPAGRSFALVLQRMIDSVLRARVSCCKDVILSQHQADLTLHEVVDAVEGEMGSASKNEAECCGVLTHAAAPARPPALRGRRGGGWSVECSRHTGTEGGARACAADGILQQLYQPAAVPRVGVAARL